MLKADTSQKRSHEKEDVGDAYLTGSPKSKKQRVDLEEPSSSTSQQEKSVQQGTWKQYLEQPGSWPAELKLQLAEAIKEVYKDSYIMSEAGVSINLAKALKQWMDTNKTVAAIRRKMQRMLKVVREHRKKFDCPIDKWAELIDGVTPDDNNDLEQQLYLAIMVALDEEIPEIRSEKNKKSTEKKLPEPDFELAYKYLAAAVAGNPLPELNPITALLIEDCMQAITEQMKSLEDADLRKNFRGVYIYLNKEQNTEDEEEETVEEDDGQDIARQLCESISLTNPLGIKFNSIIPVPPNL